MSEPDAEVRARALLVDAIIGRGFQSMEEADHFTKIGLASFTGNQWNEKWEWDRDALRKLGRERGADWLATLYWRPRAS
jgi:hypothetical protein